MVNSVNLPYVAKTKTTGNILNEVDTNKATPNTSFADMMKSDMQDKFHNWKQVEQSVYNVAIGNEDSETIIPVVAKTLREVQTVSTIVKEATATLVKVLDQQV